MKIVISPTKGKKKKSGQPQSSQKHLMPEDKETLRENHDRGGVENAGLWGPA